MNKRENVFFFHNINIKFLNSFCTSQGRHMSQISCPNYEDYSPCTCPIGKWQKKEYVLNCDGISENHIKAIFKLKTPSDFYFIHLYSEPKMLTTNSSIVVVPDDIFGSHRINFYIILESQSFYERIFPRLKVDPEAFRSSRYYLRGLTIGNYDLSDLNFLFLTDFTKFRYLNIHHSSNLSLLDFPDTATSLALTIRECVGLKEQLIFPNLLKIDNLYHIGVIASGLSDEDADRILECIYNSLSDKLTLQYLELGGNLLTRIPRERLQYLRSLISIDLSHQEDPGIEVISVLDFPNAHFISFLNLRSCHIKHIEPNTFNCKN